jgi:type II secretory pathway component PulC
MNLFKKVNLWIISLLLVEFLIFISISFSSQRISASNEQEIRLPSLVLIGVVVSKDASSSVATLQNKQTGKTNIIKIGERILDFTLDQVFDNRIILKKGERSFQILLGKGSKIRAVKPVQRKQAEIKMPVPKNNPLESPGLDSNVIKKEFNRSEIERRLEKEWALIIEKTRFVPNMVKGNIVPNMVKGNISGFKILNFPEKTLLTEIGIVKNDIIKEINGVELNNVAMMFDLYDRFKNDSQFNVSILRGGKSLRILYLLK